MNFKTLVGCAVFKRTLSILFISVIAIFGTICLVAEFSPESVESSLVQEDVGMENVVLEDTLFGDGAQSTSYRKGEIVTRWHTWKSNDCRPQASATPVDTVQEANDMCRAGTIKSYRKVKVKITSAPDEIETYTIIQEWPCLQCGAPPTCGCV